MYQPLISILLPAFQAEHWLHACLQSIQAQSYTHWELLAVDDHSTDQTLAVLRAFAQKDTRIKVLQNEGKGIIPALRLAFAHSSGTFITRMDADDLMPPQKLQALLTPLLNKGRGHLSTGLVSYFAYGQLGGGYLRYQNWLNRLCHKKNHYAELYRECIIPSPCWMLHRDDLLACKAFEPDRYPEDYDLVFRFRQQQLTILPVQEVLHYWRDHSSRSSRTLEQYATQSYFRLKIPWFLELDYQANRPLVLWGAGRKGKQVARLLQQANTPFRWICDTPNKWGLHIYDVLMEDIRTLETIPHPQVLLAVSNPDEQRKIASYLNALDLEEGREVFWLV